MGVSGRPGCANPEAAAQTAASIKHPAPCMALPTPCLRTPGCVATCLRCTAGPTAAADEGALPTVGDGGASWRLKALKRAQQLAAEQGKDAATVSCCYCCCSNMHVDGGLHDRVAGNRRKAHMYVLATAHAPTLTAVAQKPGICSTQHALTCGAVLWQLLKCKLCPFSGVLLLTLLQFISERWGSTAELTKTLTSGGSAAHGGRPQQVAHGACLAQPQLAVMFNDVPHPLALCNVWLGCQHASLHAAVDAVCAAAQQWCPSLGHASPTLTCNCCLIPLPGWLPCLLLHSPCPCA